MTILFLCTGNCGRSPMAEIYFRHLCQQNKLTQVTCHSAGTSVGEDYSTAPEVQLVMESLGLSTTQHIPRKLDETILNMSDYVIVMEKSHLTYLKKNFPGFDQSKVKLLLSFIGINEDVDDPMDGDLETFQECFLTMMPALANLVDRIKRSN